jgi:hypothetical protein
LCEIETQVTMTAGPCFVNGESSRVEGEHREELEPSITRLDEQMPPSSIRVVIHTSYYRLMSRQF